MTRRRGFNGQYGTDSISQKLLRFSSGRRPNHDNGYPARVEQSARHGAVELGRGHVGVLGHIVDAIYKSRALSTVPGRVCRDLGGSVAVSMRWSSFPGRNTPPPVSPTALARLPRGNGRDVKAWMAIG